MQASWGSQVAGVSGQVSAISKPAFELTSNPILWACHQTREKPTVYSRRKRTTKLSHIPTDELVDSPGPHWQRSSSFHPTFVWSHPRNQLRSTDLTGTVPNLRKITHHASEPFMHHTNHVMQFHHFAHTVARVCNCSRIDLLRPMSFCWSSFDDVPEFLPFIFQMPNSSKRWDNWVIQQIG